MTRYATIALCVAGCLSLLAPMAEAKQVEGGYAQAPGGTGAGISTEAPAKAEQRAGAQRFASDRKPSSCCNAQTKTCC